MIISYICLFLLSIWSGQCKVKNPVRDRASVLRQRGVSLGGLLLPNASRTSNETTSPDLRLPSAHPAICLEPKTGSQRLPTSIDECRPILNSMKKLPFFRLKQTFVVEPNPKYSRPQDPSPPPYNFKQLGRKCFIEVFSLGKGVSDKFSFEDAKNMAISILEECEEDGLGGINEIGDDQNWLVSVSADMALQENNITMAK